MLEEAILKNLFNRKIISENEYIKSLEELAKLLKKINNTNFKLIEPLSCELEL